MFLVFLIIYDTMHLSPRRGEFKFLDRQKGVFVKKGRKGKTCTCFFLFDVTNANTKNFLSSVHHKSKK